MNLTWALLFINFGEVSWHSQASVPPLRKEVMMTLHPAVVKIQFSDACNMTQHRTWHSEWWLFLVVFIICDNYFFPCLELRTDTNLQMSISKYTCMFAIKIC